MRLILSRAAAARTLLVAAALATTVTAVLLTAFLQYAQLLPVAAVRAAVAEAPPVERTLLVRSGAGGATTELTGRDQAMRELLGRGVAGDPAPVFAAGYASGQQLPPGLAPEEGDPVVGFLTGLPEHAELVDGDWAEPVAEDEPVQATLPASVAGTLGLAVGDEVAMLDSRSADDLPAPVRVAGLWEPIDSTDPYWRLLSAPLDLGGWGPFVLHPDEFVTRYQLLASLEWLAVPDPARLAEAGTDPVKAGVARLHEELAVLQEDPELGGSLRLSTRLDDLAERLTVATVVTRSGMVLPAALLLVISGFGLVLVARLLTAHRQGENALLRARGASRRQLVRFTATEALLVVLPAAALGGPAGTALVRYVDQRAGDRSLAVTEDLAGYGLLGPPLAWAVAVAAAVGCALALALPAAGRGRTWVAEQQERSRPTRAASLQRAGVDLALVALAVLAWTQLRQYGSAVAPTDAGLGIDPLLVAAPVVGVLAATAVALRLLPLATRLGVRLAGRRDAFPGLLGMWQADRRPHAGPVLLLVLAVAIAVLAPAVATTWQQSQRDQAAQQVGADLRITVDNLSASSGPELAAALPDPAGLMPVHRTDIRIAEAETTTLLAVGSEPAPAVARLRPDLASTGAEELFGGLREGRPELTGTPLPEGAERLAGRFTFSAPEPKTYRFLRAEIPGFVGGAQVPVRVQLPQPRPDRLAVHLRDSTGVIRSIGFGRRSTGATGVPAGGIELDADSGLDFDIALPPDATELVGLSAGLVVPALDPRLFPDEEADPVPVRWDWPELQTVGTDGAETPLVPPDDWQVLERREADREGPQPQLAEALAVTTTLAPFQDYPISLQFVLAAPPPDLTTIPTGPPPPHTPAPAALAARAAPAR